MRQKPKKLNSGCRKAVVMLLTLVVLVLLTSIVYTITSRVAAQRHRDQFIIDYQNARYACDSGLKVALAEFEKLNFALIDRPNEPDFSDLFALDESQYNRLVEQWIEQHPEKLYDINEINDINVSLTSKARRIAYLMGDINDLNDFNDFYKINEINEANIYENENYFDPNKIVVPGPYGPLWPRVVNDIEIEIGTAKVKITIEDENAKLPLVWGANTNKETQQEVDAAIDTFCEWMGVDFEQIDELKKGLRQIGEIKPFDAAANEINEVNAPLVKKAEPQARSVSRRTRSRRAQQEQPKQQQQSPPPSEKAASPVAGTSAFARLLNSSYINFDPLAVPYIKTEKREESVLKYIGRWGSTKVNVNTAPRQVLEAVFAFGGKGPKVAEEIIKLRQKHPFADANDMQKKLFEYSDSIIKSEKYITTKSNFFTIRITAVSGTAIVRTTAAVVKSGDKLLTVSIISE